MFQSTAEFCPIAEYTDVGEDFGARVPKVGQLTFYFLAHMFQLAYE